MRPLVNLFATWTCDPELRERLVAEWSRSDDFDDVTGSGPWVVARAPLPKSRPVTATLPVGRLEICDGAERIDDLDAFGTKLAERPETLARFPGDIAAALLGESTATLMRSASGLMPWYVHRRRDVVVISTRLAWFPRHLPWSFSIDAFAHAIATDGLGRIGDRTPFADVRSVPSGHSIRIECRGDEHITRYWFPEDLTPSRRARDDAAARGVVLRSVLIDRLVADLDPAGTNLLGMSGGVDSSCLAALAAKQANRSFGAFTFLPSHDHPARAEVESYVDSIADATAPRYQTRFSVDEAESLAVAYSAPAVGLPVPHPALCRLTAMAQDHAVTVYTGGEAADDLFAGPFVLGKDWIENVSITQLVRSLRSPWHGVGRRFVVQEWLEAHLNRRELPLPVDEFSPVFLPELQTEHSDWIADLTRRLEATDHPYRHLLLFLEFDGWLKQNWEVCSELGIRRSLPFWCRETIELALSIHPCHHALPAKRLMRLGLSSDVPTKNLERQDKGAWSEQARPDWPAGVVPLRLAPLIRPELIGVAPKSVDFDDAGLLLCLMRSTIPVE